MSAMRMGASRGNACSTVRVVAIVRRLEKTGGHTGGAADVRGARRFTSILFFAAILKTRSTGGCRFAHSSVSSCSPAASSGGLVLDVLRRGGRPMTTAPLATRAFDSLAGAMTASCALFQHKLHGGFV
jgi:hypothetical protein